MKVGEIESVELTMSRGHVTSCEDLAFGPGTVLDDAINVAGVPPGIDHVVVATPRHDACPRSGTQLVPAHPDPDPRNWPLAKCETFTDSGAGVSLRVLEAGGGTARVQVALGGRALQAAPTCDTGDPGRGGKGGGKSGGETSGGVARPLVIVARKVRPRSKRVRRGSRVIYRVAVKNRSHRQQRVRLCVRAPKRHLVVRGKSCKLVKVRPKKAVRTKFVLRHRSNSGKRQVRIVFVAKAKNVKPARDTARLRF